MRWWRLHTPTPKGRRTCACRSQI